MLAELRSSEDVSVGDYRTKDLQQMKIWVKSRAKLELIYP